MVQTTVSRKQQKRANKVPRGKKQGSVARRAREIDVRVTGLEKTERQRGERK